MGPGCALVVYFDTYLGVIKYDLSFEKKKKKKQVIKYDNLFSRFGPEDAVE